MTGHELREPHEDIREQLAAQFNKTVELATKSEMDLRVSGRSVAIYSGNQVASTRINIGNNSIAYSRFDTSKTAYKSYDLGFSPEYSVSIIQRHSFFNTFIDRATFGVNENGIIARGFSQGDEIFGTKLKRELDAEESAAIVDFIASPHLHIDKLGIIYQLTDEEIAAIEKQKKHLSEIDKDREQRQRGRRVRILRLRN
jgi:hypothetical protein